MVSYQKIHEHCWFPFFEGCIKRRPTARLYRDLLATEMLSTDELLELQFRALKKLLQHAALHCPFHRRRFEGIGLAPSDLRSVDDLLLLPTMTKSDIRDNYGEIINEALEPAWIKTTGGSTGEPLSFGYSKTSYAWRVAVSKRGYAWAGAAPGTEQAMIWGASLGKVGLAEKMKRDLHHLIDRQTYYNCYHFDDKAMEECFLSLNRKKPEVIVGYTNPLCNFAQFVRARGGLTYQPKSIISAAEKLHDYQRRDLGHTFGCEVFNTYGSREFMLIASECERHEGLHVSMENLIVEILKEDGSRAEEGEMGNIVVTDLHNFAMPFIRYEIGDVGMATARRCSCGRGLALIGDVVGRSLDMILVTGGRKIPGEFFVHVMLDYPQVKKFQVFQAEDRAITLKLVPTSAFDKVMGDEMLAKIQKLCGPEIPLSCQIVSDIPLTVSGKHRVAVSMVSGAMANEGLS